jgi:hypothetical protein
MTVLITTYLIIFALLWWRLNSFWAALAIVATPVILICLVNGNLDALFFVSAVACALTIVLFQHAIKNNRLRKQLYFELKESNPSIQEAELRDLVKSEISRQNEEDAQLREIMGASEEEKMAASLVAVVSLVFAVLVTVFVSHYFQP